MVHDMNIASPLEGMKDAEADRYRDVISMLRGAQRGVMDREENVTFMFTPDVSTCVSAMEFTTVLRRCYPFLTFSLDLLPGSEGVLLTAISPREAEQNDRVATALRHIRQLLSPAAGDGPC